MKIVMKVRIIAALGLCLLLPLSACAGSGQPNGWLEGKVSIGPITPVQSATPAPAPPEVYAARTILVYDRWHSKLHYALSLDDNGNYRVELKPGIYVIDINYAGMDRSSDVPKSIEIDAGRTVELNISIDTGLR